MSVRPNYAGGTIRQESVQISTANTNRDGSGTITDIVVAGGNGTRIDAVELQATSTTTAGQIRLFLWTGSVWRFWREVSVTAATPSATVQAWTDRSVRTPVGDGTPLLLLKANGRLGAAPHNGEQFVINAFGADF